MRQKFDFAEEFGKIDETLIAEADKPWTVKKGSVIKLYRRKIVQAAALLLVFGIAAGNSHVQAAVKKFAAKISEALCLSKDLSDYTENINQTQTKDGLSLTINEVILDDYNLIVSLTADYGERKDTSYVWIDEEKTQINGKNYQSYGSSVLGCEMNPELYAQNHTEKDKVLIQEYSNLRLPDGDISVHLVLGVGEEQFVSENEPERITEFAYDLNITAEQIKAQTVKKELDLEILLDSDKSVTLKELVINDLCARMTVDGVKWSDPWFAEYEVKLKGRDSFGNPVSFQCIGSPNGDEMRFATSFYGYYESGVVLNEDTCLMSVPDKDSEYLDLQLYKRKIIWEDTSTEDLDDEYAMQDSAISEQIYEEDENYGWEPVGDMIRIPVK